MSWNTTLVYNAVFLLLLMGAQQGSNCCEQQLGIGYLPFMQMCGRVCPLMAGNLYPYFFLASFIAPVVATLLPKRHRITKSAIISLLIVNPILFLFVSFCYQSTFNPESNWNFSKIMGPVIIGEKKDRPSLAVVTAMTCLQIGWASYLALQHRDIYHQTPQESEVSDSLIRNIRQL